ncbi:RNA-binding domain-containing protein [Coleofasciculus sp. FACHB-129]|uniref:RNA-binding domain-containing protein n=1 Tax=Cyanophyceae TaxID=3028117 RepID=UPI001686A60D|nr:RNA-binding domain-containing protein [Coleofasciculus sp. FACHB-129]MBD1896870.1 putative DNA binding domain-containing protein [Coleofasciculus sp. FACHB-129]
MSSDTAVSNLLATLLERLQGSETLEIEAKAAQGGIPKSLWETISAFANTSGGWILLGVKESNGSFVVEGLSNASKMLDDFYNTLRSSSKINYPICSARDAHIETLDNKEIIVIRVPEAPRQQRPIYINGNPYSGTCVRRHTGDHHCTKPEVDRMMREASDIGADSAILPEFGLDDIDQNALIRYRRLYQTLHPGEPRNTYDDLHFLTSIRGYDRERSTQREGLTVAGLLLLGTDRAIRKWRSRHLIDYRMVLSENDPDKRWDDRVTWEGHLFGAFETLYLRLTAGLATAFHLQGSTRIDESSVHVVLREALVNLLVHADYAVPEASLIIRTPSSFLFRNPGSSRISEFDLLHGDRSDPRNPELVRMFRFVGLAEEAGTGIPKIIRAWRELGLEMPKIDTGTERYEFTLQLRQAHLLSVEDRRWLRSLGLQWNEAEQLALVHAKHHGYVDNATLARLTGQHPADISKVLIGLRNRLFLEMISGGRYARYELSSPVISTTRQPMKTGTSSSRQEAIPVDIWNQMMQISAFVRTQPRIDRMRLQNLIVQLCALAPLGVNELESLLARKKQYVLRIIRTLLTTGRINYLYPAQPSHPRQKYVSIEAVAIDYHPPQPL